MLYFVGKTTNLAERKDIIVKIILKHVLKNIKEKKIRSLIIVLSLIAVSIITMICVSMGDELEEKYVQTMRGVAGDVDLIVNVKQTTDVDKIGDKEDFSSTDGVSKLDLSKLNLPKDKISYDAVIANPVKIEYKEDYKYALIQGFDLKEAVEMRTFKNNDIANLQENEIAITENTAKDLNVKVGEFVNVIKEDGSKVQLKIAITMYIAVNGVLLVLLFWLLLMGMDILILWISLKI